MDTNKAIPYRPGPVGRVVRLVLGVLTVQAAVGALAVLAGGVSGGPDLDDTGIVVAVLVAAWLAPTVYDIGLGTSFGNRWRVAMGASIGATAALGALAGAPGTALSYGLLAWIALTLGWLGVAFVVAAVLRTPGCEMRSLRHLVARVLPGDRAFVACPGPLQPLDEWEARTTGRAEPYWPAQR